MKKTFACLLLIFLVSSLLFLASLRFSSAQTGMSVYGQANSDTTWTQANSPYTLTGIVQVRSGVTLTIQPGVTVNLGTYSLQVNGTLVAMCKEAIQ